jgi:hypothetical protein
MAISQAVNLSALGRDCNGGTWGVLSRSLCLAMLPILTVLSQRHDAGYRFSKTW